MKRVVILLAALVASVSLAQAQHEAAYDALGSFAALDGNEKPIFVDLRKEDPCQLTIDDKPYPTVCFQAWARKDAAQALSPEEARTFLRAGEDLEVRRFERAEARARREQMGERDEELRHVPRPSFPCFNATEPRAAICSSYALTILENDYVQIEEQAQIASLAGAWFDAPAGTGVARQRAFERKLSSCKKSHDCLQDAFLDELQHQITLLLKRGINVQLQVTQLQSRRRQVAPDEQETPPTETAPLVVVPSGETASAEPAASP